MLTAILSVVRPLALAYLGAAFLLYLFQERLIYYPAREVAATPADIGLRFEDVRFTARDGVRLAGWWVPAASARGTILFCHGNAGNISHRLESIGIFHELGLNVFIFDYRGYGESEGRPSEAGIRLDAEAALGWIEKHRTSGDVSVISFGRSLGGAVAARLASSHPPAALIIESAFTSVRDIAFEKMPVFPMRMLVRHRYETLEHVRTVHCPVLVIHSRDDELIPYRHGQRLFEAANEPKSFLTIHGTHNEGFLTSGDEYREGLATFLDTVLNGP